MTLWLVLALLAQDPVTIDRDALKSFLQKKGRSSLAFDLAYVDTLPNTMVAANLQTKYRNGKLPIYLEILRDPVSFPERMQALAVRCEKGLPDLLECAVETLGGRPADVTPGKVEAVAGYPDKVGRAIGAIRAAIATRDAWTICRVVLEVRGDLAHTGRYEDEGLVIDFDGDDRHSFPEVVERRIAVFIDVAGNDQYEGHVAATREGIALVFDFGGDDRYLAKVDLAQGAAQKGVAVLYDAAGNDSYVATRYAQGYARDGVAALVDRAGNDRYEMSYMGQAGAEEGGFAVLIDAEGHDAYLGHDSWYGDPVTVLSEQDFAHQMNKMQGVAWGHNAPRHRAGGVAILYDLGGDDLYRAGTWAQGVGYFMGLGALIDLDGDDDYQSWVYVMGAGAHGGFGLQVDRAGNDVYHVGGWNSLGMSVDFGIGMFLEAAGHDRYITSSNGMGRSVGFGIAVFQDAAGDDDYSTTRDGKLGVGTHYGIEDYNGDGRITAEESLHWGVFFDLGGSDRYPKGYGNAKVWDEGACSGGFDRGSPTPPFVAFADWEDRPAAEVFALIRKSDPKAAAEFGFAHGLIREASEALHKAGGRLPGCTYDAALRLWVPDTDREWAPKLVEFRSRAQRAKLEELFALKIPDGPAWMRREAREHVWSLFAERKGAAIERITKWTMSLKPLVDRRAALDQARAKDEKQLRKLWAARKQSPVRVDPALRELARALDRVSPPWRAGVPLASNLGEESLTIENFSLNASDRANLDQSRAILQSNPPVKILQELNQLRVMHGRRALQSYDLLVQALQDGAVASAEQRAKKYGFWGPVVELTVDGSIESVDPAILLDPKWVQAAAISTGGTGWRIMIGQRQ